MKLFSLIVSGVALVAATSAFASSEMRSFAPDNDLWQEDNLESIPHVTEELFNKVIDAALTVYNPIAKENHESLKVNRRWTDSTVNANCRRSGGAVEINMYGGLARRDEVTPDAFALVLCHELGHAYGGAPYIQVSSKMAAEGQADYYGSSACLDAVYKVLPPNPSMIHTTDYTQQKCSERASANSDDYNTCLRQLSAGQGLGNLLSALMKQDAPNYETPDPLVVKKTELSYPSTVQCRLDTYHNGILNMARPACWYKN